MFPAAGLPLTIPDSNATGVTSTINVVGVGTVNRVAILYNILQTFDGDIDMFLTGPVGAQLEICTDNGSSSDNFTNTILDSTCGTSITGGVAPFSGCFAPETSFAVYNGQPGDGAWSLKVADDAFGDIGTLQNWRLLMCTTP